MHLNYTLLLLSNTTPPPPQADETPTADEQASAHVSATHAVSEVDTETRDMYAALCSHFRNGMMATVMRAEEGSLFAPPPANDQSRQPQQGEDDSGDDGYYSFASADDGAAGTARTPPPSPHAPCSARFTREEEVLQGLSDFEISPRYPPYAFSPGEGVLQRSQGRNKVPNHGRYSDASSSAEGARQLHF